MGMAGWTGRRLFEGRDDISHVRFSSKEKLKIKDLHLQAAKNFSFCTIGLSECLLNWKDWIWCLCDWLSNDDVTRGSLLLPKMQASQNVQFTSKCPFISHLEISSLPVHLSPACLHRAVRGTVEHQRWVKSRWIRVGMSGIICTQYTLFRLIPQKVLWRECLGLTLLRDEMAPAAATGLRLR